jgi:enolase
MSTIINVHARQIYDSRGNPTVEVEVETEKGIFISGVPSGASTGEHEALELRDGGADYMGKGVLKAVANVNDVLGPAVIGMDCTNQAAVDKKLCELDGTPGKRTYGANAILGISMSVARAGAAALGVPLHIHLNKLAGKKPEDMRTPVPCMNVINGGKHAGNTLAPQEFMIAPTGASSFADAMKIGTEVYHHLKSILKSKFGQDSCNVGDEGGFAPPLTTFEETLELLTQAIEAAGHTGKVKFAMDAAASEFFEEGKGYDLGFKCPEHKYVTGEELGAIYMSLIEKFPVASIEDAFDENDFTSFAGLTATALPHACQIVGDDLTVSQVSRIQMALEKKSCNSLLLKINQVGSITEAIAAANLAMDNGWSVMVSHRSGECADAFIADLVVALGTGQIKSGAPCRSERLVKYNHIIRLEERESLPYGFPAWK